ncbi:hypothetical protein LXL04_014503 [Taraxacum kok-saghyz]
MMKSVVEECYLADKDLVGLRAVHVGGVEKGNAGVNGVVDDFDHMNIFTVEEANTLDYIHHQMMRNLTLIGIVPRIPSADSEVFTPTSEPIERKNFNLTNKQLITFNLTLENCLIPILPQDPEICYSRDFLLYCRTWGRIVKEVTNLNMSRMHNMLSPPV